MCALVNTYGGIVIIGVNSKKEIVGIKEDADILQQKLSAAAQAISSPIVPKIEVLSLQDQKIIIITVQKAIDNTFHTFQGVIYVKVGSTLKRIEGNQMVVFLRAKQFLCFDETPGNAKMDDLDTTKIKRYLNLRKQDDFLETHSIEDFLVSMQLASRNGEIKVKNAATLFFTKNPIFFNPQMEIKLVRFEGTEQVKIVSHELVQADLIESIDRSMAFIKANIPKSIEIKNELKREERYYYPIDVIREAIVNAIAHRDYFSKDAIQIYIFDDRIEITNPGSLPQALPRELFGVISVQRNPLTYRMLRDYGYVEGLGSGIPRMINEMRKYGLHDPEFGIYEAFFRIILRNTKSEFKPIKSHKDLNERQLLAIEFLKKNKSIKTKMYVKLNKVSLASAKREINEMIQFSYLKKIGAYKGVYYVLKE
ncbi:putative DNA binding domain-containing protein [Candidatus Micrarchaeota archaeon]|nr:putative DNA binding domain-containing protein [Candidatus Micrarchaeota archaeon]